MKTNGVRRQQYVKLNEFLEVFTPYRMSCHRTLMHLEIDIGESGDQRLLGTKYDGVILANGHGADTAIEYAVVDLTTSIAYEYDVRRVFVVPRHVGRGLSRLLAKLWRPKITVYVIPVGERDSDPPVSWEAIRNGTIGIALMRRRTSGG